MAQLSESYPTLRVRIVILLLAIVLGALAAPAHPQISARQALLQALDIPTDPPLTPINSSPPASKRAATQNDLQNDEKAQARKQLQSEFISYAESLLARRRNSKQALKYFRLAAIFGHAGASATAATLLISSQHDLPRDIETAIRHLQFSASHGQPDAHAQLGMLYASGLADRYGLRKSIPRAIVHWTIAANSGSIYAATALGFRHKYGIDIPKSCHDAAIYYKRAATAIATDSRHWPTPNNFMFGKLPLPSGLIDIGRVRLTEDALRGVPPQLSDSNNDLIQFYRHSAERGDANALAILGALALFGGHGIEPNEQNARQDLMRAAELNHGEAHGILAHLAMRNHNNETALDHFRRSAAAENPIGHYGLGMIFMHGLLGMGKDYSKARMHFELAAERKHADASFQLGMMSLLGKSVPKNPEDAYKHFQDAARLGNLQSKLQLGILNLGGTRPLSEANCTLGVEYLKHVAEQGEWKTVFDLASNSLETGDRFGALYRNLQAAHAGIELAQYNVGLLLEKTSVGDIPELVHWDRQRLIAEAHEMYHFSGIQGHSESLIRSGHMAYLESEDFGLAARTYRFGAEKNNAEAMFSLGMMFVEGKGVEQNRSKAIQLFQACADVDKESAIAARLAIIGVGIYWRLTDGWQWIQKHLPLSLQSTLSSFHDLPAQSNERIVTGTVSTNGSDKQSIPFTIQIRSRLSNDIVIMGILLVFLIVVLLVRRKRLTR